MHTSTNPMAIIFALTLLRRSAAFYFPCGVSFRKLPFSVEDISCSVKRLVASSSMRSRHSYRLFSEKRKNERVKQWRKKPSSINDSPIEVKNIHVSLEMDQMIYEGLVIERQGDRLLVELQKPMHHIDVMNNNCSDNRTYILCSQRTSLTSAHIVVGDTISLRKVIGSEEEGVAIGVKQRKNILERPVASNPNSLQFKYIASNIDHMFIVTSCTPTVPLITIDRYLVIAHLLSMNVTIIHNKNDLPTSDDYYSTIDHYSTLGIEIMKVSKTGKGIPELISSLANKTSIFVGQSGVGKSSLINLILPHEKIRTGDLTQKIQMGSHTTSNARLYHVDCGFGKEGILIDSPGIREFGLWHLDPNDIAKGFPEIYDASKKCKFRNCKHTEQEIGCAVQSAFHKGLIHKYRLKHYFELTS